MQPPSLPLPLLSSHLPPHHPRHPRIRQLPNRGLHPPRAIQLLHLIPTPDALPDDHHIRNSPSARRIGEDLLELGAERVLVEFDDVGCGLDVVFGEEDVLGEAGVGAVGFGEDDDWRGGVSCVG